MTRRRWWVAAGVGAVVTVAVAGGVLVATGGGEDDASAARDASESTATVVRGDLSATVSASGTLTYRARPDGSPYAVVNGAVGTYTMLPEVGDEVACGDVLYRVDDQPVLLLCGAIPAWRELRIGDHGRDVRQLVRNLRRLGYAHADDGDAFTWRTQQALRSLQRARGLDATGTLALDEAVVLPSAVRIARTTAQLGGVARPGSVVAQATSTALVAQVNVEAFRRGDVHVGDRARIVLPGSEATTGRVERIGRVTTETVVPVFVALDRPRAARGLDAATVRVEIATAGVEDVLGVPVVALVGTSDDALAVEVVRTGGRRELVAVETGLFDAASGRVQVDGDLREGDRVVVPPS
jgi:peptidoglycan hydrolase-like protein with peptidoglycan-binding domain